MPDRPAARPARAHPLRRAAFGAVLLLAAAGAHADFRSAVLDYTAGRWGEARAEFLALAEVGDAASMYNLGAIYGRGEGVEKDPATAIGFLLASAENGYGGVPVEKLEQVRAAMPAERQARVQAVLDRYGSAALRRRVLPSGGTCAVRFRPGYELAIADRFPATAWDDQEGVVIFSVIVGVDGLARDPEIVQAIPASRFEYALLDSYLRGRYSPAELDLTPVESRVWLKFTWKVQGQFGRMWNSGVLGRYVKAAMDGDPGAQYLVGIAGLMDTNVGLDYEQADRLLVKAAQGGQADAQYWVARQLDVGPGCTDPARGRPWLELAARTQPRAQVELARRLLAGAPGEGDVARARSLVASAAASRDAYALKHAIALLAHPRLAPADAATMAAAAKRLDDTGYKADPAEIEALAVAAAANGRWSDAARQQERALDRARELAWNTSLIEERLASYRAQRPWSGDLTIVPPRTTPAPPLKGRTIRPCTGDDCGRDLDVPDKVMDSNIPQKR